MKKRVSVYENNLINEKPLFWYQASIKKFKYWKLKQATNQFVSYFTIRISKFVYVQVIYTKQAEKFIVVHF